VNFKDYDTVIDARTPAEYALDHVPGAVSAPVLDDAERVQVGTLYKQVSPFEAKKLGAALVAKNVARHIDTLFG
jgi:tRNA 2-selenouridine synthase